MSEVLGFEFDDKIRPYSVFNIVQCITVFTFLALEAYINTASEMFAFHIIVGVLGFVFCAVTLAFPFKKKESMQNLQNNHRIIVEEPIVSSIN